MVHPLARRVPRAGQSKWLPKPRPARRPRLRVTRPPHLQPTALSRTLSRDPPPELPTLRIPKRSSVLRGLGRRGPPLLREARPLLPGRVTGPGPADRLPRSRTLLRMRQNLTRTLLPDRPAPSAVTCGAGKRRSLLRKVSRGLSRPRLTRICPGPRTPGQQEFRLRLTRALTRPRYRTRLSRIPLPVPERRRLQPGALALLKLTFQGCSERRVL